MPDWLQTFLTILLSTGGVAFLTMLFKGFGNWRGGVAKREQETFDNIRVMRAEVAAELRSEAADRRYWQNIAGRYHFQLVSAGYDPDPLEPSPPSQRTVEPPPPARRRRSNGDSHS